jgi:hypothetical protein
MCIIRGFDRRFQADRDAADVLEEFVIAEDALSQYDTFGLCGRSFIQIVELCSNNIDSGIPEASFINYLLALEWRRVQTSGTL